MRFPQPLIQGTLIRRYKRFMADVALADGATVTAHCANSGSMLGLKEPGLPVLLSRSDNPARKLPYTWEMVKLPHSWVGLHTGRTNALVEEAIRNGGIAELEGYARLKREVRFGESRLDMLLTHPQRRCCYVEVKSVTLRLGEHAAFPDAVTTRGSRHLEELQKAVAEGHRGVMFFLVQREDCRLFRPAHEIDPAYAAGLTAAEAAGVEIVCYSCAVGPGGITVRTPLPVEMTGT